MRYDEVRGMPRYLEGVIDLLKTNQISELLLVITSLAEIDLAHLLVDLKPSVQFQVLQQLTKPL